VHGHLGRGAERVAGAVNEYHVFHSRHATKRT
jgi:hypothetical protein